MTTGYEPLDTLKPVAGDIWIVDGPAVRFYGLPVPTRATVVRLANGDLWVHSPTRLAGTLRAALEGLGPVRHLVAPNWLHYWWVEDWQAAWPEAESWAAPGVVERAAKYGRRLRFDHDLGPVAEAPWAGQIDQMIVEGSPIHREAVFFHRASRTLILADLIENFEPDKVAWWLRPLIRAGGVMAPHGGMPRDMRLTFRRGRDRLRQAVATMLEWGPERIVIAHGRWFPRDGTAVLRRAFAWLEKG